MSPTTTNTITLATCGGTDQIIVNVTQPGTTGISLLGNYCTGYNLTATTSGVAYKWYLNNVPIPLATLPTYSTFTPGTYKVEVYQVVGGCAAKAQVIISPRLAPYLIIPCSGFSETNGDTTIVKVCNSTAVSSGFSVGPNGNSLNYQWYRGAATVGTNSPNYTATTYGVYWVVCTDIPTGCTDTLGYVRIDSICCNATYTVTHTDTGCSATHFFDANIAPTPSPLFNYVWCFGDGSGATTPLDTIHHTYPAAGIYNACVFSRVITGPDTCAIGGCRNINVNLVAKFDGLVNCGSLKLTDLSTALVAFTPYTSAWSATGPGTFTFTPSASAAAPTLLVSAPGTYVVTLTISKSGCSSTFTKSFFIPLAVVGITGPNTVCAGTSAPFAANPITPGNTYFWDFGDLATSYVASTNHEYPAPPPSSYTITLTTTDDYGCTATATKIVNVVVPPPTTISPPQTICPGTTVTLNVTPGTPTLNFQWYLNNIAIPLATTPSLVTSAAGAYHATISTASLGCQLKTNISNLYLFQKPIANIEAGGLACIEPSTGFTDVKMYNSFFDPSSSYSWNLQGNPAVLSTTDTLALTVTVPGNYSYILTVVDLNGCIARDTFCLIVGTKPHVFTSNIGGGCVGQITTTYVSVITWPGYSYKYAWSNFDTDSVTQFSNSLINVVVTDTVSGCATTLNSFLMPSPDVSLFPIGCDTLCDSVAITIPLALYSALPNYAAYSIKWYLNGSYVTPVGLGPTISLSGLSLGLNNLTATISQGACADTTDVYQLFIKPCTQAPVTLSDLSFFAFKENNNAQLRWTLPNQNSAIKLFVVERSYDGIHFEDIAMVPYLNNSLNYTYKDINVQEPIVYYRIKTILDNSFSFTDIRKLIFDKDQIALYIYPNPNPGSILHVQANEKLVAAQIANSLGTIIWKSEPMQTQLEVNMQNFAKGVYTFIGINEDGSRMMKQFVVE